MRKLLLGRLLLSCAVLFSAVNFSAFGLENSSQTTAAPVVMMEESGQTVILFLPGPFDIPNARFYWDDGNVGQGPKEFEVGEKAKYLIHLKPGYELEWLKLGEVALKLSKVGDFVYRTEHTVSLADKGQSLTAEIKKTADAESIFIVEETQSVEDESDSQFGDDIEANLTGTKKTPGYRYVKLGDKLEVTFNKAYPFPHGWSVVVKAGDVQINPDAEKRFRFAVSENMIKEEKLVVRTTFTYDPNVEPPQKHLLTIQSGVKNGRLSVKDVDNRTIKNGATLTEGTDLFLLAKPNQGYTLDYVKVNDVALEMTPAGDGFEGSFSISEPTTITYAFKQKTEQPQEKVTVTYAAPQNGQFSVKNGSDAVVTGSTVDKGSTLSLTAVADEGYELDKVMAGEISVAMTAGADRTYTGTYQADANVTFVVTFKEKVIETVTINYAAPDHGAFTVKNGEADVANGSTVEKGSTLSLTAVANEGYKLDKVMVGQTEVTMTLGSDRTYTGTYKADADVTFVATFKAHSSQMFTVTIKESDNGVITLKKKGGEDIASGAQVEEGIVVSVVSTPNEGYILKELKANEEDILASKEFVVSANTEVSAVFSRGYKITLKECENGKVVILNKGIDPNAVPKQTILFVRAIPDAGYRLKTLHIGQLSSAKEIYSFYVSKSLEIYAEFEQGEPAAPEDGFLLEPEIEGQGAIAIEVDGEEYNRFPVLDLDEDKSCAIRVTPAAGWKLAELTANGVDVLEVKTFKVKLGENKIFAKFIPGEGTKYTVTIAPTENGTIALKDRTGKDIASGSQVFAGTELVVVDTPADKYKLDKLMVGEEDITRTKKFVVNADVTVRAVFVNDGASETVAAFGLRVYPNPASDYVLVQGEALANVQLISLDGRVVFATLADAEGFVRIDLASIANGTYVLVVNDKATKLVVK
ncbi:Por secretion system C-terminal sorting domain-containing protein [Porphyromonas crevioricanis]|uniref:T9SS type A sorting domain-containing protein n=2 Tax=Porphyromonas crevioricanis TaxID=393921 RepID=UPI00099ADDCA|nr:T9SS type A sorting domain-containing protein [Porphyromonas crevioricanis]SJZ80421.1 Por secretion system C-terminal sorting domain-containing protein [Porphyromonas crevioricanis]